MAGPAAAFIAEIAPSLINAGVEGVTKGGPRRQYKWNKRAAEDANRMNRENTEWLLEQQKIIQAEQRMYDSPEQQMARYKAAGLNPHLIYGNGSSAGSAFPIAPQPVGAVRLDAPSAQYPAVGDAFIAASQAATQMRLSSAKTEESLIKQQAIALQNEIARTNPMLRPSVASAVASSMEEVARLKETEANIWQSQEFDGKGFSSAINRKVTAEVDAMIQRLGLNAIDLQIRNRILESKEFENAIKDIQKKWLEDAQVTPEHVRQGLMLILQKMIR